MEYVVSPTTNWKYYDSDMPPWKLCFGPTTPTPTVYVFRKTEHRSARMELFCWTESIFKRTKPLCTRSRVSSKKSWTPGVWLTQASTKGKEHHWKTTLHRWETLNTFCWGAVLSEGTFCLKTNKGSTVSSLFWRVFKKAFLKAKLG